MPLSATGPGTVAVQVDGRAPAKVASQATAEPPEPAPRVNTRQAERELVRSKLVPLQEDLAKEHRLLVVKKHTSELTRWENTRLAYVKWQLDRIDDALLGEHIDRIEVLADMHARLAKTVEDVGSAVLEARARNYQGRRRR